jgi:hypothetical protein
MLAAAADRLRREVGGGPNAAIVDAEEPLDRARRTMAPSDFERAVAAGRAPTLDAAVELGLEVAADGIVQADAKPPETMAQGLCGQRRARAAPVILDLRWSADAWPH